MSEHPFIAQDTDIRRIWQADLHAVGCLECGAVYLVPTDKGGARCFACLSETLEAQPARLRPEAPEMMVPYAADLDATQLSRGFAQWLRGTWFRPDDMQVERLVTRLERVVVPMWLVDGQVVGVWQARMGYDYQVESAQERFIDGKGWTTQHLRETRIRWEPRAGRVRRSYENLAVSALEERERAVFQTRLGHYDLERATPYIPENMAGMSVRVPSLLPDEAWPDARTAFDSAAAADCRRGAGAQHHAEFELIADYEKLHWTQMLLPAFVTYYQDDAGHLFPVWVNGQSGRVNGVRRASMRKAWRIAGGAAAVALVTFFAGALAALLSAGSVSSLLLAASFFLLVVAALPVLWAWQFNTQQAYTSRSPDKSVVKLGH